MLGYSDACDRNKDPILKVLATELADRRHVLEIGSGTGQHAVHFAKHLPQLVWQSSDVPENVPGIRARLDLDAPANALTPISLSVSDRPWPVSAVDAVFSANTLHIMSWSNVVQFFLGVGEALPPEGRLCVYGPFRYEQGFTSESNARFDRSLKQRDPLSGIRDFEAVDALAQEQGLRLLRDHSMPANNQTLVWVKQAEAADD